MHSGAIFTATLRIFVDDILGAEQVNDLLGRQVLVTPTVGSDTCEPRRTLNPAFVEALMGWPTGWTAFGSAATAWSHWLPRMRYELSLLNFWPTDEVAG